MNMISSGLHARIVELAGTYLLHSSAFLLAAWGLLSALTWISRQTKGRRKGAEFLLPGLSPLLVERTWKTAALLGLLTGPISLFAGKSHPVWSWTASEATAIVKEPIHNQTLPSATVPSEVNSLDRTGGFSPRSDQGRPAMEGQLNRLQSIDDSEPAIETSHFARTDSVQTGSEAKTTPARAFPLETIRIDEVESRASGRHALSPGSSSPARTPGRHGWIECVGGVCILWMLWSLFRLASRRYLLMQLIGRCEPLEGQLRAQLDRMTPRGAVIELLRFRSPGAGKLEFKTGPFACGLFRWKIVIPEWLERELSPPEVDALLAHELAHLIRRDPWWQLLGEILCGCLAFQPLNWLARNRWQQATELMCDDWAVRHHVAATTLAACLTRIAELRLPGQVSLPGLSAVQNAGLLTQRIRWLLRPVRKERWKYRCVEILAPLLTLTSGVGVSTYGPHISLVKSAEIDSSGEQQKRLKKIESDLTETLNSLVSIKTQLPADAEAQLLIERLLARTASLKHRIERREAQQVSN